MEKLSPGCKMILAGAVACLVAAIAAAPSAPRMDLAEEAAAGHGKRPAEAARLGREGHDGIARLPDCMGGDSVNCHRSGNRAGL